MCPRFEFSASLSGPVWPDAPRENGSRPDSRRAGSQRVFALRDAVSDASRHTDSVGLRSFRDDGLCPVDLSREPARHRSVPEFAPSLALPLGDSRDGQALQSGLRERTSRCADVRGSGGGVDAPSPSALRRRSDRIGAGRRVVRSRCQSDRTEPGALSVGSLAGHPGRRSNSM